MKPMWYCSLIIAANYEIALQYHLQFNFIFFCGLKRLALISFADRNEFRSREDKENGSRQYVDIHTDEARDKVCVESDGIDPG